VSGWIVRRGQIEKRPSFSGNKVIDMDRLKRDWKFNDVSDRSFFYLDREFFKDDTPRKAPVEEVKKEVPAEETQQ